MDADEKHVLLTWEEKFLAGDHSTDAFCVEVFRNEVLDDGAPLLFQCVSSKAALQFLDAGGVNLLQRAADGSTLLMEKSIGVDDGAYRWLAEKFQASQAVDLADDEGFTPLSIMIKFGELERARILLECGASVDAYAEVKRYGGASVDIATQAVHCLAPAGSNAQAASIAALTLLRDFGHRASPARKQDLLARTAAQKPVLHAWIASNL